MMVRTYTQHVIRADGNVAVYPNRPFTNCHAAEVRSAFHGGSWPSVPVSLTLEEAVRLTNSWNQRYTHVRNHFPRFFYLVDL